MPNGGQKARLKACSWLCTCLPREKRLQAMLSGKKRGRFFEEASQGPARSYMMLYHPSGEREGEKDHDLPVPLAQMEGRPVQRLLKTRSIEKRKRKKDYADGRIKRSSNARPPASRRKRGDVAAGAGNSRREIRITGGKAEQLYTSASQPPGWPPKKG